MSEQNFIARPALAVYNTGGGPAGDPYWDNVSLLLPFDGNDGDTTTTDLSSFSNSVTFNAGSQISTAQTKFGTSSAFVGVNSGAGSSIDIANDPALDLGTASFTIEFWLYVVGTPSGTIRISHGDSSTGWFFTRETNYLNFAVGQPTSYIISSSFISSTVLSSDEWNHFAIVRDGSSFAIYVNGISRATGSSSVSISPTAGGPLRIGKGWDALSNSTRDFFIDDFRITKGVARYTENFTPPTEAFPTN